MTDSKKFGTRAIHAGQVPDPTTGAVMTPIYATSTYAQSSPGVHKGFEYARTQNPTRMAFERCLADLEGGHHGFAFASGLAASATLLDLLPAGSHIVALDDLYGGTYRLFEQVRRQSAGLEVTFTDMSDRARVEAAIRPNTRMIWWSRPAIRCSNSPILRWWPIWHGRAACSPSRTTRLRRRGCNDRSKAGSTSCCTRSPNT
jgi:cystathionine gamma-lyase